MISDLDLEVEGWTKIKLCFFGNFFEEPYNFPLFRVGSQARADDIELIGPFSLSRQYVRQQYIIARACVDTNPECVIGKLRGKVELLTAERQCRASPKMDVRQYSEISSWTTDLEWKVYWTAQHVGSRSMGRGDFPLCFRES